MVCFAYTANPNMCTVHLINDGVTVDWSTATVEFSSSGPATSFLCSLARGDFFPCELVQITWMWLLKTEQIACENQISESR